jgi:2-keto-4-pentenoate hydratase/2-oxohepta-3-ene-1,7-dioic acid hydratase in catechol pathway
MYIGRICCNSPDGVMPRIVVARGPQGPWVDVRAAERERLQRRGGSRTASIRIAAAIAPESMTAALESGPAFWDAASGALDSIDERSVVRGDPPFLAPLDPPAYRDFMVFEGHFSFGYRWRGLEVPKVLYEFPVSYLGSIHGILGPEEQVPWPHFSRHMDYELELGIVIGEAGRDLTPENAREHIAGLTILNDFSARDIQQREMAAGLGPSKGKHFASAIGPWIVTLDELTTERLRMIARVNGQTRCDASSSEMIWSIPEIVAWASASENLATGTLLGSGTANGGSGIELGRQLAPGDIVELEIEGLGVLRNRIGAPQTGWMPEPRVPSAAR